MDIAVTNNVLVKEPYSIFSPIIPKNSYCSLQYNYIQPSCLLFIHAPEVVNGATRFLENHQQGLT